MTGLPDVNELVLIRVGERGLPSRVENTGRDSLVLAAPLPIERRRGWPKGSAVTVEWENDTGVLGVAGTVTRLDNGRVPTWSVRVTGRPQVLQGRSHTRVPARHDVVVELVGRPQPVRFTGVTLDVGLGGFRVRTEEWVMVEHGDEVRVRFARTEPPAVAAGVVLRPLRVRNVLECSIALTKPVPDRAAVLLRRLVREGNRVGGHV